MNNQDYAKTIKTALKKTKKIRIEFPFEVAEMVGLKMLEFQVLTGDEAYYAEEEIYIDFQGKEMRIFINEDGKLSIYTD